MLKSSRHSHQKQGKALGIVELVAIALGGMIGGGIFTVLGISVGMIGIVTPIAFLVGGILALFAVYSYIKLAVYYKDEGATYSFFKRTFPTSPFAAALIGWWVIFGYISTLALYAYTFASYAISGFDFASSEWVRKGVAVSIIALFTCINIWSVKGMGKIEDLMVYTKLLILVGISLVLMTHSHTSLPHIISDITNSPINIFSVLVVASLTFVAFEGFQLVINAVNEMDEPERNIPKSIYLAVVIVIGIYVILSLGAIMAIPLDDIIRNEEYALAAGADKILGHWGNELVILGALLATSSAISGTLFGASRQMSVIAYDGYFPSYLIKRHRNIPIYAIVTMALSAAALIGAGDLKIILEFGSVTFLLVSLLMAYANFTIYKKTDSSLPLTLIAMAALFVGTVLICYYEATTQIEQLYFIGGLYLLLSAGAWLYAHIARKR